jgi:aromatic-amino-acid transaminase
MLIRRGKAFESSAKEAGLEIVPFDSGFFASIPCENSDEVGKELQKHNIFLVPLAKGLRVTVAAISEEKCRMIPEKVYSAKNL